MKKSFFIVLLYSFSINAQVVCNSITKRPIATVTIVSNKNKGTITNQQGIFTFTYFDDFSTLTFSHLAYQTKTLNRKAVSIKDTIFLKPAIINLNEVVLKTFNARDTILKAIKRIPINYNFKPYNTQGFYRESMLEDGIGAEITEVSFLNYNKRRRNEPVYESKIIKGRRTNNYSTFKLNLIGGIKRLIKVADKVRQKEGPFNLKELSDYKFSYKGNISVSKGNIYIIDYKSLKDTIYRYHIGKIFIDATTLAIIQITKKSEMDKEQIKRLKNKAHQISFKKNKPMYATIAAQGTIQYKKYKGKYYVSFIHINDSLIGVFKEKSHSYKINAKFIITQINTANLKKIKTNYSVTKDFNKQVKKIPQLENWIENNTLLFSKQEKYILRDIKNR